MQESGTTWDIRSAMSFPIVIAVLAVFLVLALVPVIKLLRRTGHNPG